MTPRAATSSPDGRGFLVGARVGNLSLFTEAIYAKHVYILT